MARLTAALAGLLAALPAAAADFEGPMQIKDGDSVYVQGRELRLAGIDVPEWSQPCEKDGKPWRAGPDARRAIVSLVADRTLICEDTGERSYGRPVVKCLLDGRSLERRIVFEGWAFDYPKYSGGAYAAAEAAARAAKRGIWAGVCEPPWEYRQKK